MSEDLTRGLLREVQDRLLFVDRLIGGFGLKVQPSEKGNNVVEFHIGSGIPLVGLVQADGIFIISQLISIDGTDYAPQPVYAAELTRMATLQESLGFVAFFVIHHALTDFQILDAKRAETHKLEDSWNKL